MREKSKTQQSNQNTNIPALSFGYLKMGGKTINCLIRYYFLNSSLQHSQHVLIRLRIGTLVTNVNKFGVTVCYSFIAR